MGLTTKTLGELLDYVDSERLKLPEIQREFVWTRQNIKLLFDSLYRDMPIGQMLVWKPNQSIPKARGFSRKPNRRDPSKIDLFYGFLLDGQQRLTAISRIRDSDEEYPLMVDLAAALDEKEDIFFWGTRREFNNPWCVMVSDVISPNFNISGYLNALRDEEDFMPQDEEPIRKMLTKLQGVLNYHISIIEFESDDYAEATQLFIRFNSTGKKLAKSDLVLAELATRIEGLTSRKMGKLIDEWKPNYQFSRPFLIQCLAAVHTHRMDIKKPEDVWGDSTPKQIERSWERTAKALDKVIEFLTGFIQWESSSWLPSFNALIPLVYINAYSSSFDVQEKRLARKWLLLAGVHAHFSGSVQTELDRILKKLNSNASVDQLWKITSKKLPKLRADNDLQVSRRSGPLMSLFISMLRNENSRDWISGNPLNGTVLGKNAKLHVHHFFPRALLYKHNYSSEWINAFANYTVLCSGTNWNISTEEPLTYLSRLRTHKNHLEAQCIPQDPSLWQIARYEDFIVEREKLLTKRFNEYLES